MRATQRRRLCRRRVQTADLYLYATLSTRRGVQTANLYPAAAWATRRRVQTVSLYPAVGMGDPQGSTNCQFVSICGIRAVTVIDRAQSTCDDAYKWCGRWKAKSAGEYILEICIELRLLKSAGEYKRPACTLLRNLARRGTPLGPADVAGAMRRRRLCRLWCLGRRLRRGRGPGPRGSSWWSRPPRSRARTRCCSRSSRQWARGPSRGCCLR